MTNPDQPATQPPLREGESTATFDASVNNRSEVTIPRAEAPAGAAPGDARTPASYAIERELGRGGMGVVYLARDVRLNRRCALKMILAGAHSGSTEIDRFRIEALAIARLQHPNIVQIFEIGEHDGRPYMALEFCAGGSLDAKLREHPLQPMEAARLVQTLARAMHAAHEARIIHRDLKPANVLLASPALASPVSATPGRESGGDLIPKITDFGLAKKLDEDSATRTGSVIGTPSYMPPEQAAGRKDVGPAADIYALGAILYECLSGRPPFRAATPLDTLMQVIHQEPVPLRQLNAKVPLDLETITHKCLQKDPHKRYATAQALADDLARYLAGQPILARPVGMVERAVKWVRRHPGIAAQIGGVFGLMLLATIVATTAALRIEQARQDTLTALANAQEASRRESEALLQSRRQITRLDLLQANRFADNRQFDEALLSLEKAWRNDPDAENEATHRLRLGLALQNRPQLIGLAIHDTQLDDAVVDPQGTRVVTHTTGGQAGLWDIRAGRAIALSLPHGAKVHTIAMSADGRFALTGGDNGQIAVWDTATGQLRHRLTHGAPVECVAFQPGSGTVFAAVGGPRLTFWRADEGSSARAAIDAPGCYYVGFSGTGHRFVTANAKGFAQVWDYATGQPLGQPLAHAPRTQPEKLENIRRGPRLTPDGRYVLTSTGRNEQKTYSLACTEVESGKRLWQTQHNQSGVRWQSFSPDGQSLVGSHPQGHLREVATGQLLASFDTPRESQFSTFVGDRWIAVSSTSGLVQFWNASKPYAPTDWKIQAAEGVRSITALPDGKHLLIASGDGTARLYHLPEPPPVDPNFGGRANQRKRYATSDKRKAALSPDGRVVCVFDAGQPPRFGPRGQANLPSVINAIVTSARFSDDGQAILTQNDQGVRVWAVATARPIGPEVLMIGTDQYAMSHDARRVVISSKLTRTVKVVDATTGKTLVEQTFPLRNVAWPSYPTIDAAGRRVAFSDFAFGGAVEIWDIDRQELLHRLNPHRGIINHLQLSSDGSILLVCSSDTTARLWDTNTGQPLGPTMRHSAFCRNGAIAEDGRIVATVDSNGLVQLWDGRSGERLGVWGPFEKGHPIVWFSRDEKTIFGEFSYGPTRGFMLGKYRGPLEPLQPVLELLTGHRIDPVTQAIEPLPADHFRKQPEAFLQAWLQFNR